MIWTDEHTDRLGELIDKGHTASQCAKMLGASRETVIGRAWRRGWGFGRPRTDEERAGAKSRLSANPEAKRLPRSESARTQFSIYVDADTLTELEGLAKRERLSRNGAVCLAIEWGLMSAVYDR